jgi:hypothetical protein|tara:strand:+ start:1164 stop:1619 length:456 start_codon:yes stop_codon:yes gene_type:complete
MIKNISIFDLDGTCVDSSHRQATLSDGTLNLAAWFANATPEKIAQDKLLPLAKEISNRKDKGDYVIICTARNMSSADYEFLKKNNMVAHKIISRPVGNMEADGSLKAKQLSSFLSLRQFKRASKVMFDDAQSVRSAIRKIGIAVLDPAKLN